MKTLISVILLAAAIAGCHDESQTQWQDEARQVAVERQQRVEAEKRAEASEQSRSRWQSTAFGFGIAALLLLVAGTAMGSAAKKHVKPRD